MRLGSPASDVRFFDSGQNFITKKKQFSWVDTNGGIVFLPVIFLGCFFYAIWKPRFFGVSFSWPTVGFLVIFSKFFFPEQRPKIEGLQTIF